MLAHLSENNNNKNILLNTIEDVFNRSGINLNDVDLNIANKLFSNEEFCIC